MAAARDHARAAGLALLTFYALLAAYKTSLGEGVSLLWLCHACLLLGAIALCLGLPRLRDAAHILMTTPTIVWIGECLWLAGTGRPLIGAIDPPHSALAWVMTSHHFFLLPVLVWASRADRETGARSRWGGAALAAVILVGLLLVGRWLVPAPLNMNWSHAAAPAIDHPAVHAFNAAAPVAHFLLVLSAGIALVVAPGACVHAWLVRGAPWATWHTPCVTRAMPMPRAHRSRAR